MKSEVSSGLEIKRWLINGFGLDAAKDRVEARFSRWAELNNKVLVTSPGQPPAGLASMLDPCRVISSTPASVMN
jgi:hypothetical protein